MEKTAIGIDIGGTNTVIGLTDEQGNILAETGLSTKKHESILYYTEDIIEAIRKLLEDTGNTKTLQGIGIGAPNGNYYTGSIENAPNLLWKGSIPFAKWLSDEFYLPAVLTNDANAGAMGEMIYGGAKQMKDFLFITLGTGVGSGIVSGGQLLYGHDGFAGEIGHVIVKKNGRKCNCGRRGCLETYASAGGMVKTAKELINKKGNNSSLKKYKQEELSSKIIYQEAKAGDKTALKVFDKTAKTLGLALANSAAYTSPEAIFIFGGPAKAGDLLLKPIKKYMERYILDVYKDKIKLLPSQLEDGKAAILGAAAMIWEKLKK